MPLLYYWQRDNYRRDLDMGVGYHLNQDNPLLHSIDIGDSLWAFTQNKLGRYVLAAELVIKAKTFNPPNFRYGRYRVWGNLHNTRYFNASEQPSIEQVIRSLSCKANAKYLGQSFQGYAAVRRINSIDHNILFACAAELSLETRAKLLPEEKLEATILLGDPASVEKLVVSEDAGIAQERREYLYIQAPSRSRLLVRQLQDIYKGQCQLCGWDPTSSYGEYLCHGHHIQWLSRGGDDTIENLMLLCPNHHAAVHRCDAPFDFREYHFHFGDFYESLQINHHL